MTKRLASHNPPVPAGGSTIAINGLLGLSLLKLTYAVSKKTWEQELINQLNTEFAIEDSFLKAENIFIKAMDEDAIAFKKSIESKEILKDIIEIPLRIAGSSKNLHQQASKIEPHIKNTVLADHQIAKENLISSIKGGINIIESNYNFFDKNSAYIRETKNKIEKLKEYLKKR
ncbi:cyclodeaminase/cyclohydrolase family protein [Natronospora cellulosivora (SeqCode)]